MLVSCGVVILRGWHVHGSGPSSRRASSDGLAVIALVLFFVVVFFFFNDTATTEIYTLSLHDALPISCSPPGSQTATSGFCARCGRAPSLAGTGRASQRDSAP